MRIAILAPSPVPFAIGGAEKLCWGLLEHLNRQTPHTAELLKLPSPEQDFWSVVDGYRRFAALDVSGFDLVISTKYPAWMIQHPRHVCYMLHRLRGLYDTWNPAAVDDGAADHPAVVELRRLLAATTGSREALGELFGRLEMLRQSEALPPEATRFPGSLIRDIVHRLDDLALATDRVERHAAISHNVAGRAGYFPPGVDVTVLHPPSDLRTLRCQGAEHLLTVGRLDHVKRIPLLVEAFLATRVEVPFKVAGAGPERAALERRTRDDPRVELLGYVDDVELEALYANALGVLYAPLDEDYGLVPFEAHACAKPVLTTHDAGGPLELVTDGESGWIVEPTAAALSRGIERLCEDPVRAARFGETGRERVAGITWDAVATGLLGERPVSSSRARGPSSRRSSGRRITVASSYAIHPPAGGGAKRIFELYRRLARRHDVEIISLGRPEAGHLDAEIAPGLREIRVPMSEPHEAGETRLGRSLGWIPITDAALPRLHRLTPGYGEALRRSAKGADVVVISHPYALPALGDPAGYCLVHESHNVEMDLKREMFPDNREGRRLLEEVEAVEARSCREARAVAACSVPDRERLAALYDFSPNRVSVVPNGTDVDRVGYVAPDERLARKARLGLETTFTVLFTGSWHMPNLEAVRSLLLMAETLPDLRFLVLGNAGEAFRGKPAPANVGFLGQVDETTKNVTLGLVDLAVNPMETGSGTCLKVPEYCAAGVPVITTAHGVRGLDLRDGEHLEVASLADFPDVIRRAQADVGDPARHDRVARARTQVEKCYSWEPLSLLLEEVLLRAASSSAGCAMK